MKQVKETQYDKLSFDLMFDDGGITIAYEDLVYIQASKDILTLGLMSGTKVQFRTEDAASIRWHLASIKELDPMFTDGTWRRLRRPLGGVPHED